MCTEQDSGQCGPANQVADGVRKVERDADGKVMVHLADRDEPLADARLARYFPWSLPDAYVSVRDKDGKEVVMLRTLDELDPGSREIVEQELADKIFNPRILQVLQVKREFGLSSMSAITDRGEVLFQFHGRDDVRLLSPTRALFRDVDGNTFELPDVGELDPASRKMLRRYF